MGAVYYPRLLWRLRAVMIDSVLVPVAMIGCLLLGISLGVTDPVIKIMLLIGPLFLLEPVMVAYTGGTIGHHLIRLRVTKLDGHGNINVFSASLRFIIKALTGWFAFVFVLTSRKHQALHDLAVGSVVVHRDASAVAVHEALPERQTEDRAFVYPPAWRRLLVMVGYCLLLFVTVEICLVMAVSWSCIQDRHCSNGDRIFVFILDLVWLAGTCISIVLGWKGRLLGARRQLKQ